MPEAPQISVIIVNYNSGNFILLALESLFRAIESVPAEILIVDNASTDNSVAQIRSIFPEVIVIQNSHNLGFAAANNIGIHQAGGEYILLINPDTVVPEDIFTRLVNFMRETPDAGAVGVKILNADGSFSVDSRHSVPSPLTAFWKQIGLDRLFPKSRIFGQYNLTYLDPDETYPVDAISGSFMFLRRQAIKQVGLLDEDYFMYCEDLDYCYRLNYAEWKVYYYPETMILHFKGVSTIKSTIGYGLNFNRSLYLFYKKHFRYKFSFIMHVIILSGVTLRGLLVYTQHQIKNVFIRLKHQLQKSESKEKNVIWIGSVSDIEKSMEWLLSAGYRIVGIITDRPGDDKNPMHGIPVLGSVQNLNEFNLPPRIDDVICSADQFSYKSILTTMSDLSKWNLNYTILPARINSLIVKSKI